MNRTDRCVLGFLMGMVLANVVVCLPKAPFSWWHAPFVAISVSALFPIVIFTLQRFLQKKDRQRILKSHFLAQRENFFFFVFALLFAFLHTPTPLPDGCFSGEIRVVAEADVRHLEVAIPGTGRLRENRYTVLKKELPDGKPGTRYRGRFRMKPFSRALFPGDFDARKYAVYRGWAGELVVEGAVRRNAREACDRQWGSFLEPFRLAIRERLYTVLSTFPGESASFLQRLFLAEKTPTESLQADMRDLGVAHLLAVSGLHVRILFQWGQWFLTFFHLSRRRCSVILFIFLLFYAWLLDFPASVGRALIFLLFREVAVLFRLRIHRGRRLCAALCLLLFFRPYALLDTGLQLSFACSTALDIFPGMARKKGRGLAAQLEFIVFLTLCTFPLQFHLFGRFSAVSFLANLLVIPFFTPLFTLGLSAFFLQGVPIFAGFFQKLFYAGFFLFFALLTGLRALPIPVWEQPGGLFPQQAAGVVFCGIIFAARRRGILRTWLPAAGGLSNLRGKKQFQIRCWGLCTGIFLWTATAFVQQFVPFSTTFTMLDVGQGDAFLLESEEATVLFDVCGKRDFRTGEDLQGKKFTALLQRRGISHIDAVFLSHPDIDHCGNAAALLSAFPDAEVYTAPKKTTQIQKTSLLPMQRIGVRAGQSWRNRNFSITVLRTGSLSGDSNAGSMCLRLVLYPKDSVFCQEKPQPLTILLTGDLPSGPAEEALAEAVSTRKGALVLKVSHHGSRSGTDASFLAHLQPDLALISCGEGNRYGHPHKEVLQRLSDAACPVWRTDQDGEMSLWESRGQWRVGCKKPPGLERRVENLFVIFYGVLLGIRARR